MYLQDYILKIDNIFLAESKASAAYEFAVAKEINLWAHQYDMSAERPPVDTHYSDVVVYDKNGNKVSWIEVKMNHRDNLCNERMSFKDGKWIAAGKSGKAIADMYLNKSSSPVYDAVQDWLKGAAEMFGIKQLNKMYLKTATTESSQINSGAITGKQMDKYLKSRGTQYIFNKIGINDIQEFLEQHYTQSKAEPAYYIQTGDDFYRIGSKNPLKLKNVPVINANGFIAVRIGFRDAGRAFEIQPEFKMIAVNANSDYSFKPGTTKQKPTI